MVKNYIIFSEKKDSYACSFHLDMFEKEIELILNKYIVLDKNNILLIENSICGFINRELMSLLKSHIKYEMFLAFDEKKEDLLFECSFMESIKRNVCIDKRKDKWSLIGTLNTLITIFKKNTVYIRFEDDSEFSLLKALGE